MAKSIVELEKELEKSLEKKAQELAILKAKKKELEQKKANQDVLKKAEELKKFSEFFNAIEEAKKRCLAQRVLVKNPDTASTETYLKKEVTEESFKKAFLRVLASLKIEEKDL